MTQISNIEMQYEGIRELTGDEIAVVSGGYLQSNSLFCIIHEIKSIICKVEQFLSCFNFGNNNA